MTGFQPFLFLVYSSRMNRLLKLKAGVMLLGVMMLCPVSFAQRAQPNEHVLMLSARVSESPARIHLKWPAKPTPVESYTVYRKNRDATSWGTAIATLNGSAVSYVDKDVVVGQTYEYRISSGNYTGYIWSGIKVPPVEFRGKVILLVEAEQAAELIVELETLRNDLIGDGWTVLRHDVSRDATPQSARALVQVEYNADPANVKAVFLLGNIPVFRSGDIAPDGHRDHLGPWPADVCYGNVTGICDNSPTLIPGIVQLQVGRVDLEKMHAFEKSATELLRQYLNKNHRYRTGRMTTTKDAFVSNGFGDWGDRAATYNGYRLFPVLWGPNARVDDGSWETYLSQNTYTWGHINGGGGYTSCAAAGGMLTTSRLASENYGIIFVQTFGSFFGNWDTHNNFMRAFLAMPDYGLTSAWTGRPNWFFHHMALGETIGYSTQLTQNNFSAYSPPGVVSRGIHTALMGDPTLRMFPIRPPTNLQANSVSGGTRLKWIASRDREVTHYYVYGALNPDGPYTRLVITEGTHWTHVNPGNTRYYMVRASKLTVTGSGSFYNLSQGAMAGAASQPSTAIRYD
ncbi:MAG: hypothetical protein LBV29_08350 [Azoarcus sp.]|nr:hypothetical protein [Azoarcus sp.]